jgi:putative colanic acid biosynthesis acetyltransferase WcaF
MEILSADDHAPLRGGPSFALSNRLYRALWQLSWVLLARWTPPPLRGWRRLLLRVFGAKMAAGSDVRGGAIIWNPRNLVMHEYASIAEGVRCYNMALIELGAFVVVSQRSHLCAGTHDIDGSSMQLFAKPIRVHDHAWIAVEAFVGPGVTVGEGAVLGARAVTVRDLEPWTINAGNPSRKLRTRPNFAAERARSLRSEQ